MEGDKSINSPIVWPDSLAADRDMVYESLTLLHEQSSTDKQQFAFAVSASRHSLFKPNDPRGVIHKLEVDVDVEQGFREATFEVTHEVSPGLNACSQIIHVNEKLRVAAFDSSCIVPIKNFGSKKTFNCDVRGRLTHHLGQVNCLAARSDGTQLASGCTAGQIALYRVEGDEIEFISRTIDHPATFITGLAYILPTQDFSFGVMNDSMLTGENVLLYTTHDGLIGMIDSRCKLANNIKTEVIVTTRPKFNITTMVPIRSLPGHLVYLGGAFGEIVCCDLRMGGRYVHEKISNDDGSIRRMKEIVVHDGPRTKTFLAHNISSNKIKILDAENLNQADGWFCDRLPEGRVKDLVQVGDRIVTCGEQTSIGCWKWKN